MKKLFLFLYFIANKICMKYQSILFQPSLSFKFTVALEKDFYTFSCDASMLEISAPPENKNNTKKFKSLDIGKAKQECIRLGYKEKTEKFGTCVLELTK